MNFLQEAAEMNRRGVCMMYAGETNNAYEAFSQARTMIISYICMKALDQGSSKAKEGETKNDTANRRIHPVVIPGLEDDKVYIYNRAIIFCPQAEDDVNCMNDCLLYSATILFNLALCVHYIGKQTYDHTMLDNSAQMYELCLKALPLSASSSSANNTHSNDAILIGIVALNNSAQIYHETAQQETLKSNGKLNHTLQSLSAIMAVFSQSSPHHQREQLQNLEVSDNEILRNVLVLSSPHYICNYSAASA